MRGQPPIAGGRPPASESYLRPIFNLGSILVALLALAYVTFHGPDKPAPNVPRVSDRSATIAMPAAQVSPAPETKVERASEEPAAPRVKPLDRAAIAKAESTLDEASRDRARAEDRLAEAGQLLAAATTEAAAAAAASRKLAYRVRDPSAQMARLSEQGGFVRAERDRLKNEVTAIRREPRPKPKSIIDRNPVAKPSEGDEYHFELRHNKVTYIDIDRLIKLVKSDAQLRIRLADNTRVIESKVGPVGSFSMEYVLRRSSLGIEGLMERHGVSFDLRGWELVPEYEGRGETYEMTLQSFSEYSRAINRLSPQHSTITMWVYPDGFPLYRKLRDDLHARGYMVAARPLPDGMSIKGSPSGSLSAGQ